MSGDDDAFLSRWSRRKIEARRQPEPDRAPVDAPEPPEAVPAPAPAVEPELTPEEIDALPKVEEITAESDLTAFLKKGVPEALRNAALRKMWTVDPAVRDYVGDARDYAWDWNVPGGVPGNGPLAPSLEVPDEVRRLFSDGAGDPKQETAAADGTGEGESAPAEAAPARELASSSVRLGAPPAPQPAAAAESAEPESAAGSPVRVPPRRHGGAVPA